MPPPNSVTSSPQPIARPRTTTAPQEPRLVFGEGVPSSAPAKQAPVPAPASLQQPAPAARGARFEQPQPEQAALPEAQQPQYSQQQVGAQLAAMLPHVAHLRQGGALGAPAISSGLPAGISQTPSAAQQHMSLTGQQGPKKGRILLTPGPAQVCVSFKKASVTWLASVVLASGWQLDVACLIAVDMLRARVGRHVGRCSVTRLQCDPLGTKELQTCIVR